MIKQRATLGYTLVELVLILTLLGMMAISIAPNFGKSNDFKMRFFMDEWQSALLYARQVALTTQSEIQFNLANNQISLLMRADPALPFIPVKSPSLTQNEMVLTMPAAIKFEGQFPFYLDAQGQLYDKNHEALTTWRLAFANSEFILEGTTGYFYESTR